MKQKKRRRPSKNRPSKNKRLPLSLGIAIGVLLIALIYLVNNENEGKEERKEAVKEENEQSLDFPSTEAGTLNGWIKVPPDTPLEDTIVLFASSTIPGMAIIYYPRQNRLISGIPPMIAEQINLHDGEEHQIVFTFQKNGRQALLIDEKIVSQGAYHPYKNSLTGNVIGIALGSVSDLLKVEIT